MRKYTVQLNYNASITFDVLANDEGDALHKARELAEDADMRQFNLMGERNSDIIRQE